MNQDSPTSNRLAALARRLASAGCIAAILLSLSVIIGWHCVQLPLVAAFYRRTAFPSPQASFSLVLCAASLLVQLRRPGLRAAGIALAIAAAALPIAAILEWALQRPLGLTGCLAPEAGRMIHEGFDGRMSHGAALAALLLSIASCLHSAHGRRLLIVTTICTPTAFSISLIGLLGFAFSIPTGSPFWNTLGMAFQTSLTGLMLGLCMILARPDRPLMATLTSPMAGGYLARRIIIAGVAAPLVVGAVEFAGVPANWFGEQAAAAVEVVAALAVLATVVLVTCSALNRTDESRRRAESSRALMLDELDHRVKNTLATVLAVCEHTMAGTRDLKSFHDTFQGRIRAMALVHEGLAARRWEGICLRRTIETTLAPFAGATPVRLSGVDVLLSARAALPVVATLHELTTNAAKYGALSRPGHGEGLNITWTLSEAGTITLDWIERAPTNGAPISRGGGFGTNLIRGLIAHELRGSTELSIEPTGVRCRIVIPEAGRCPDEEPRS